MMKLALQLGLLATSGVLLGACKMTEPTPRYPDPPLFTDQVQAYQPVVAPLAPVTRAVPAAPLVIPAGNTLAGSDLISAQDLLDVTVFKVPDLTRSVRVDTTGNITFPLIGVVRAKGLKPAQLEKEIAQRLEQSFMNNPQVSVLVKESVQNRVTVEGAVRQPGVFPVSGQMTVLQALALAGGLNDQADTRTAVLLRRDGRGQASQQPIDIAAIRQGSLQDMPLLQDDRIVVQEAVLRRFTVTGSVNSPGVFPLKQDMTFMQAVATAGGITRLAEKRKAVLFRRGEDGRVQRYSVNLEAIQTGLSPDPMLQQDDRIVIIESGKRVLFEDATRLISPVTLF